MKTLWERLGITAFWLSWPVWRLYLRFGTRTKILVISGDKVLVVKNWLFGGKWALPGGGVHKGEQSMAAIVRELKEETGLQLVQNPTFLFKDIYQQYGLRFTYDCFVTEIKSPPSLAVSRPELADAQWVDRGRLSANNAGPDVCKALARWSK